MSLSTRNRLIVSVFIGCAIYLMPQIPGVSAAAQALLAIFSATIVAVIINALPMGAATLIGLTICVLTHTLTFEQAFQGYQSPVVWLVLGACFVSYGFIQTGLGKRIAYIFVALLGKTLLGIGYGVALTEFILASAIPSVTARSGGIIYPIVRSLIGTVGDARATADGCAVNMYLIVVAFQLTVVTSAMFLTAMAANPLLVDLASKFGITITWGDWALAAIVPGLVSLAFIPVLCQWIIKAKLPEQSQLPTHMAWEELKQMGPMAYAEKMMLLIFLCLLLLWIFGPLIGVTAVMTVLVGITCMIIFDVIKWREIISLAGAWETFVWFGALIAMAGGLNDLGLTTWFGNFVAGYLAQYHWVVAVIGLLLIYFYSHYFFASSTAHVSAFFLPFLSVALSLGAPPLVTALMFAFASNLFGGLTHYGLGPAPILYGSGYVSLKTWWKIGFVASVANLIIWSVVGSIWWSWLGLV